MDDKGVVNIEYVRQNLVRMSQSCHNTDGFTYFER